ncbi:MAG TPA: hypothetical protein VFA65_05640 [Bryobacteraceae bacterium]|nr:hypothetical protein [Bryobacteraceae bacterium]
MKKLFLTLSLSAALAIPFSAYAAGQDHDRDHHDDRGYYDKHHHDYHQWNDHEDRAWHMYWEQRHRPYEEWNRASEAQQQAYWNWRHSHSDAVLKINIGH